MRYIMLDKNNEVTSIRYGKTIIEGEIQSNKGEIGQKMLEDGTFVDLPLPPKENKLTIEERLDILAEQNIKLMKAMADIYESLP